MELILKEDMIERTKFSRNIAVEDFERNRLLVQENEIAPFIGSSCLTAILSMDRDSATDQATELYSFWKNFVRPYSVYKVFQLFVSTHGYDMAAGGILSVPTGGPQQQQGVTIQERSAIAKQYERFANTALTKLKNEFADKSRTFDGTSYAFDEGVNNASPKAVGMTAVGNVRDKITYIRTKRV